MGVELPSGQNFPSWPQASSPVAGSLHARTPAPPFQEEFQTPYPLAIRCILGLWREGVSFLLPCLTVAQGKELQGHLRIREVIVTPKCYAVQHLGRTWRASQTSSRSAASSECSPKISAVGHRSLLGRAFVQRFAQKCLFLCCLLQRVSPVTIPTCLHPKWTPDTAAASSQGEPWIPPLGPSLCTRFRNQKQENQKIKKWSLGNDFRAGRNHRNGKRGNTRT